MFDESTLNNLPDNHYLAVNVLCKEFNRMVEKLQTDKFPNGAFSDLHEDYITALGILQSLMDSFDMKYEQLEFSGNKRDNIVLISNFFSNTEDSIAGEVASMRLEEAKKRYHGSFGGIFIYKFSEDEIEKIQKTINELRDMISSAKRLEDDHKRRLLKRLERLQSELHKSVSDLDRFWGLIGDAGVVLNKLGNDAKPIVDRMTELANIVWGAQSRAEGLPESDKLPLQSSEND